MKKIILYLIIFTFLIASVFAAQSLFENSPVPGVTSGTSWATTIENRASQMNGSFITSNTSTHVVVLGNITMRGNVTFTKLISCDKVSTDANGRPYCNVDNSGSASADAFNYANNFSSIIRNSSIVISDNLTIILSPYQLEVPAFKNANATEILLNSTIIRNDNLRNALSNFTDATFINLIVYKNLFVIGNISNVNITNLNINGTLIPVIDNTYDLGNGSLRWRNINISGAMETGSATILNDLKVASLNGTSLGLFNKSISLDNYNKSVSLDNYNKSISLDNYVSNAGAYLQNLTDATFRDFNVSSINGTSIALFNKSISLDNYLSGATLGSFLTNRSPDVVFNRLNLSFINDTSIALFNRSISLDNYNKSISLVNYNQSISLDLYAKTADVLTLAALDNNTLLRIGNITNILESTYNKVNFSSNYASRLAEQTNAQNVTGWVFNSTINRSISLDNYNKSISLDNYISNAGVYLQNLTDATHRDLNVSSINGTSIALFNKSISLNTYNKSISLDNYNQSISLNSYNKSVSLDNYLKSGVTNYSDVIFNNTNISLNLYVYKINGTETGLFNKSISLDSYNKSISLVNYNQSISLDSYNKSISLDNYISNAGQYLTNRSPDVVFNRLNISFLNDTNIALFNKSISLDLYNKSVSLDTYYDTTGVGPPDRSSTDDFNYANNFSAIIINSSILTNNNISLFLTLAALDNNTLLRISNITNIREGAFNFVNNLSAILNNATINRSISLDNYNKSISLDNYISNAGAYLQNLTDATFRDFNVSSINGTSIALFNRSISLDSYNKSISLDSYNKSISLDNYIKSAITNNSDSIFNNTNISLDLYVYRLNGTELSAFNKSISLNTYNKSISLDNYNKSISLDSYNKSISLDNYLKSGVTNYSDAIFNNTNISLDLYVYRLNGTELSAFNKSISLNTYNKSISLDSYNKSISLDSYNKSISLVNYATSAITNNSDAIFNNTNISLNLYVYKINGTETGLFNKSISLNNYNQSISLVNYNQSISLDSYFLSARTAELFNYANNLTGILGPNSSIIRVENSTWLKFTLDNATINRSISLDSYNKSISLDLYNKSIILPTCIEITGSADLCDSVDNVGGAGTGITNGSDANLTTLNIGSGVANFEINNNVSGNRVLFNTTNSQFEFYFNETAIFFGNVNLTSINDTSIALFNKSISLDSYNKSISLVNYNQSISLDNYISNAGAYLQNLTDATFRDFNVSSINGTSIALFNKSISLNIYNKSVSLDSYNKSISLDSYNKSISLDNYLKSGVTNYSDAIFNNTNISLDLYVYRLNGTELGLFNKSISLNTYNKSISLDNYNKSISLDSYNKSISLVNYVTSAVTNYSDAIFNNTNISLNLYVYKINGTETGLFNKSISLVNYNQSISLVNYNQSISLNSYNQSVSLNNYHINGTNRNIDFLTINQNITGNTSLVYLGNVNLSNATFPTSSFACSGSDKASTISINDDGILSVSCTADQTLAGGTVTNGSDLNITLFNVYKLNGTELSSYNKSISLDNYNKSISLVNYNQSISLDTYFLSARTAELFNYANNLTGILGPNSSILRVENITNILESMYTKTNFTSNYALRLGEQTNAQNVTGWVQNSTINRSISLDSYNKSISLDKYTTSALINYTDAIFNNTNISLNLYVYKINGTETGLFNKSISLDSYNKSISLDNYNKSISLTNYWNTGIPLSNFQLANVSNNTLTRGDNLTTALWNITSAGNIIARDFAIDTVTVQKLNVTNITINNWTATATVTFNVNIWNNGSGTCIGNC